MTDLELKIKCLEICNGYIDGAQIAYHWIRRTEGVPPNLSEPGTAENSVFRDQLKRQVTEYLITDISNKIHMAFEDINFSIRYKSKEELARNIKVDNKI